MAQKIKKYDWEKLRDRDLLELRFCDLKLDINQSRVAPLISKLYKELQQKKIPFKPHFWVSKDWFSPDGIPGVAVPFYVINDRLARLEKKMVMEVEGYSLKECMKLLRHETGHAIDNGYKLRMIRARQNLFGLSSTPYPESYSPRAYSKKFVVHLNSWYAQAHPDEDWAETFAVWLNPTSNWRLKYKHWYALKKLRLIDEIMKGIRGKRPKITKKDKPESIKFSRMKLKTYYNRKIENLGLDQPYYLDPLITRLFTADPNLARKKRAASFIRAEKRTIAKLVARWTGQYQYTINLILQEIIQSCQEKKLYLMNSEKETRMDLVGMLTAHTLNYITKGNHRIPL